MAAEELLRFALFKEVLRPERRKRRKLNNAGVAVSDDESEESEEEAEEEETGVTERERERAKEKAKRMEDPSPRQTPAAPEPEADVEMEEEETDSGPSTVDSARLNLFRERLAAVFDSDMTDAGVMEFTELLPKVNETLSNADMFGTSEAKAAVKAMHDRNEIMEADGAVYKV